MCFYCLHMMKSMADYIKHVQVCDRLVRNQLCVTC